MQAHLLVGQQTDKLFAVDPRRCRHGACFGYNGHDRMRHGIVDYFRCRTRAGWTEMNALVGDGSKHVVASSKIGSASCRERVFQTGMIQAVDVSFKKKIKQA